MHYPKAILAKTSLLVTHLGGLSPHFSGTGQRAVNLACGGEDKLSFFSITMLGLRGSYHVIGLFAVIYSLRL